jgi:hypothetical protein
MTKKRKTCNEALTGEGHCRGQSEDYRNIKIDHIDLNDVILSGVSHKRLFWWLW